MSSLAKESSINISFQLTESHLRDLVQKAKRVTTQHNTTRGTTTQQKTTRAQHDKTQVQHETTPAQHDTIRDNTSAKRDNTSARRVQNNLKFVLIYSYHRCVLGAWHMRL